MIRHHLVPSSLLTVLLCIVLVTAAGASGCAEDFEEKNSQTAQDTDGDGYTKDQDCDDEDDQIFPGAPERINCIDDNCNDDVDEGTINHDLDGDSFCISTGDEGDCEGDYSRNPGVAEDGGDGSNKPNNIDDNCNGIVDEGLPQSDVDNDGFTVGDNDCNDRDPLINPGAIEVEGVPCTADDVCPSGSCVDGYCRCTGDADCFSGKGCIKHADCTFAGELCEKGTCISTYTCQQAVSGMPSPELKVCRDNADNDCDGKIDELPGGCDAPDKLDDANPADYARAIELCDSDRACDMDAPCPGDLACVDNRCTRVLSAVFNDNADPRAHDIAVQFAQQGPFSPRAGQSFIVLASGLADYDPLQTCPQDGTDFENTATDPDPSASDSVANDYVELALTILVPTNARSFSFDFHFFSTEYPEWIDSDFNDTFWVQLQSQTFNGNVSFDKNGTPIRINNAFFDICDPDPDTPQTQDMCSRPASELSGTGYAKDCESPDTIAAGGSTGWLHTIVPVTPGEIITLTFSIFDKGDHILDSAVLIDNVRWQLAPASEPVTAPD